jgi:4-amino-4-deoxy-L-arabinose transferase-like glycosyltransferase
VLRLLWVIWATRAPDEFRDPAEYLRIASDFGDGLMPRFGGVARSAYWPPGYPAVLAPFVWVAERTGWLSPAFAASLVNVVAGTATVALTGALAGRWFGSGARVVAAWLVAVWPALVYWTATAHSETVFTAFFLAVLVLATDAVDRGPTERNRWIVVGVVVAIAFLVRSPGAIGLVVPALAWRARRGTWQGALRVTGVVVGTTVLLLIPWTIVNGVQVGVWSPGSTNNAAAVCFGHHDDAPPIFDLEKLSDDVQVDCYRSSPFDDARLLDLYTEAGHPPPEGLTGEPDEPRWYSDAMGQGIGWAVTHPVDEVGLSAQKVWETWKNEGRAVDGARNYAETGWAGGWHFTLGLLANLWLWVVGALALAGLATRASCRRALPIWVPIVLVTLAIVVGSAEPHYRYPVTPLLAVLAAAFLCRGAAVPSQPEGTMADRQAVADEDALRVRAAAGGRGARTGRCG